MMQKNSQYPEILQDLKAHILITVKNESIANDVAEKIAHIASENIRKSWGGMMVYIPKGKVYELNSRDQKIWDDFTGSNHHQVCKKYDISLQWLYKVIAIQRRADLQERQADVFAG